MGLIPDELKRQTYPCPACGQIISTDENICRFCGAQIDEDLQQVAVRKELRERSGARLRNHKFYMAAAAVVFGAGLFTLVDPVVQSMTNSRIVSCSCWTPILLLGGLGAFVMGLSGYLREKRYLRDV